jgi:Ca2+-binding EF-hand superfamily protein
MFLDQQHNLESGDWISFAVQAFLRVDKDNSGSIDMKEFPKLAHEICTHFGMQTPTDVECEFFMKAFDTDGDNKMSTKEYIDMMAALTENM